MKKILIKFEDRVNAFPEGIATIESIRAVILQSMKANVIKNEKVIRFSLFLNSNGNLPPFSTDTRHRCIL